MVHTLRDAHHLSCRKWLYAHQGRELTGGVGDVGRSGWVGGGGVWSRVRGGGLSSI